MRYSEIIDYNKLAKEVFTNIESELHKRFEGGYATCTFATKTLADALHRDSIPFSIVSGDYNDYGHWWIETDSLILDIGNNCSEHAINTGSIEPYVGKKGYPYVPENVMTYKQFLDFYPNIKHY